MPSCFSIEWAEICQRREKARWRGRWGCKRRETFIDDRWEAGRVADCQMFPLSLVRFWNGDWGKVGWGEEMRGKDGEKWLNEGGREREDFFFPFVRRKSFGPILANLISVFFLCHRQHPICWRCHLVGAFSGSASSACSPPHEERVCHWFQLNRWWICPLYRGDWFQS